MAMAASPCHCSISTSSSSSPDALIPPSLFFGCSLQLKHLQPRPRLSLPRARLPAAIRAETESKTVKFERGGTWLSSTTRHIRIYVGYIDPVSLNMDQTQEDKLSLILDPDDEFIWPDEKAEKVFKKFEELVDHYEGAELNEYTLRLIGSDLEHYIRKLLLAGEIKYNLHCRVLNFSMGKPRYDIQEEEDEAAV